MGFFRFVVALFHFDRINWKIFSLCLVVAIIFWCFNALNKDYATNVRFPIQFDFDRKKYAVVEPLPESVLINISGNGWDLLNAELNIGFPALTISLERPIEVKKMASNSLPAIFAGQLKHIRINYVVNDALYINIDSLKIKKIGIGVDLSQLTYATNFDKLGPVVITPKLMTITGPKSVVKKIADSLFISIADKNVDRDFKKIITINKTVASLLKYNPDAVEIFFRVVEWETISRYIKLRIEHVPPEVGLHVIKDSVLCILRVPKEKTNHLARPLEASSALLDFHQIKKKENTMLSPQVVDLPAYAQLVSVDSIILKLY